MFGLATMRISICMFFFFFASEVLIGLAEERF